MISISKTWEQVTPDGDSYLHGFDFAARRVTFRELVAELREYTFTSVYPGSEADARRFPPWAISEGQTDYQTGIRTVYCLHLDNKSDARSRRFWAKALRIVGLVKP